MKGIFSPRPGAPLKPQTIGANLPGVPLSPASSTPSKRASDPKEGRTISNSRNNAKVSSRPNLYPLRGVSSNSIEKRESAKNEKGKPVSLGTGSFGRVNSETLNGVKGIVATKYFLDMSAFGENVNEVAIMKYLKGQPNVAQYIGLSPKDARTGALLGFPAVLMGSAAGSIAKRKKEGDFTSWDFIYETIKGILNGYNVLHSQGIVHRDAKPDNMLLTKSGEVWITDFGAARYVSPNIPVTTDNYTGTVWWAAPEILMKSYLGDSQRHTCKSWKAMDAWAVGCSLIDILTKPGTPAYQSWTPAEYEQELLIYIQETSNGTKLTQKYIDTAEKTFDNERVVIKKIFTLKGLPTAANGETYTLYHNAQFLRGFTPDARLAVNPTAYIKANINTAIDTSNTDFIKVCDVIEKLLDYNPQTRMTIESALTELGQDTISRHIPTIYKPFNMSGAMSPQIYNDPSGPVASILTKFVDRNELGDVRYAVLDRTFTYFQNYLSQYTIVNEYDVKRLFHSSLNIAKALFEKDRSHERPSNELFPKILNDCDLLGKTRLDEMCEQSPGKIQELGFLNLVCFQKMLYHKYEDKIETLKAKLIDLAQEETTTEASRWTTKAQMDTNITDFERRIEAAMAQNAGTRRRRRNKKQTRRR